MELLVVVVVITIIAAISIVAYGSIQNRAVEVSLMSDLKNASGQLDIDRFRSGSYPISDVSHTPPSKLKASNGASLQYTSRGTTYCLTAISPRSGTAPFMITNEKQVPVEGRCPGHREDGWKLDTRTPDEVVAENLRKYLNYFSSQLNSTGKCPTTTSVRSGSGIEFGHPAFATDVATNLIQYVGVPSGSSTGCVYVFVIKSTSGTAFYVASNSSAVRVYTGPWYEPGTFTMLNHIRAFVGGGSGELAIYQRS